MNTFLKIIPPFQVLSSGSQSLSDEFFFSLGNNLEEDVRKKVKSDADQVILEFENNEPEEEHQQE